jgi:natural product precursor
MKKKISLSSLSKNAICKEEQKNLIGGHVCAECWTDWEAMGKSGGYSIEQDCNNRHDSKLQLLNRMMETVNGY